MYVYCDEGVRLGLEDVYREMNTNMTGDCGTRGEGCGADESEE